VFPDASLVLPEISKIFTCGNVPDRIRQALERDGTRNAAADVMTVMTLAELETNPHPALARMRPVAWVPELNAWLVTGYDLAVEVLRDPGTFTVDDPRFATARVVGPSMLSLDGDRHARHRAAFTGGFRAAAVRERLAAFVQAETGRLVGAIAADGAGDLRRAVAAPLAVAVMAHALDLDDEHGMAGTAMILDWYAAIVAATSAYASGDPPAAVLAAGAAAFGELSARLRAAARPGSLLAAATGTAIEPTTGLAASIATGLSLTGDEAVSNAAVLMFGGIETTEGMIANVMLHLLTSPDQLALVCADPDLVAAAVEESLRLEPAAAVVDRYATTATELSGARIAAGDQVTVSIAGANRDPAMFPDPDRFDVRRVNAARHLAFAHGPHFCLGAHLARLEARIAVATMLARLPGLRLDGPADARGLVFRKPPDLRVRWEPARGSVCP
jgi:cytochrome P450